MADELITLSGQISSLATRVGTEIKNVKASVAADVADLAAYKGEVTQAIADAKVAVKNDILDGAGEAYDTLKELGALIDSNKSGIEALEALAAGHVKFDAEQTLSADQKKQARDNIGAIAATDLSDLEGRVSANETQIAANKALSEANQTAINTLTANVGNCSTDFVAAFEAALTAVDSPAE